MISTCLSFTLDIIDDTPLSTGIENITQKVEWVEDIDKRYFFLGLSLFDDRYLNSLTSKEKVSLNT